MRLLKEIRNLTGNYHVKSGIYHYYRSEYTQAEEFFRKALKDESKLVQSELDKARHYLTLSLIDAATRTLASGDAEGAIERLERAAEVSPGFPDIHFRLGGIFEDLGRTDEAIAAYGRAIEANDGYLDARVSLGFCLLRSGRVDDATDVFRKALDLRRRQIEAPFERALERLGEGDTAAALELFHETFRASPALSDEFRQKAFEQLKHEDYEKALEEFDKAIEQCPKYPDLHNFRGVVLCELERLDEAIEAFRVSAALAPGYLVPRLNLAFAHVRAGEHREAEAELEAVLEIDPTELAAKAQLDELREKPAADKRRSAQRGNAR